MLPQEIIRRKRDGIVLTEDEIAFLVRGLADGSLGEGQIAAFAMAVFFRGMTMDERVHLTAALMRSGRVLGWRGLDGPVLDKHSTGGIGDKVSLVVAPIVAACGGFVPMLSGRALGHTGGTLDKLDAIPGYRTTADLGRFRRALREAGCAIIDLPSDLAPAERRFHAVRDATATVESIPLITASILARKLAGGVRGLVVDVKTGSGALLPTLADARELAASLVEVAGAAGLACRALITDMSQCLGRTAGNALELEEAIVMLAGKPADARLAGVVLALAGELLLLGRLAEDAEEARARAEQALASGAAAERFARMVRALGGPPDLIERPERRLPRVPIQQPVPAPKEGHVQRIDARALGLAVVALGGGRRRVEDAVDHAVGLSELAAIGEAVGERPLAIVHARSAEDAARAAARVQGAYVIEPTVPEPPALIYEAVG